MADYAAIIATGLTKSGYVFVTTLVSVLGGSLSLVVYSYFVWKSDSERVSAVDTDSADEPEETPVVTKN